MSSSFINRVSKALLREWNRMLSRPVYFVSSVLIMLFCYIFFLTFLGEGMPEDLPAGVVDLDQSYVSRTFIRNMNATPQTRILNHYSSFGDAREDMQRGNIYGFMVIPHHFEQQLLSYRRPEISFYVNDTYLIGGSLLLKDMTYMSELASGYMQMKVLQAKGVEEQSIMSAVQPVNVDTHLLSNPWTSYNVYLTNMLLPGVFQLLVLMLTIFAIGTDLKEKTSRQWLKTADHSLFAALTGKLLPYTFLFTLIGITGNLVLYKFMNFPLHGPFGWMCLATFLLVISMQAIGIFMTGLFPVMRDALSLGAFYGLLGFTYAGFTFPVDGMPYAVRIFSDLFPLRHYFRIYTNVALNGSPMHYSMLYFAAMLAFCLLPFFIWSRLKKAAVFMNYPAK